GPPCQTFSAAGRRAAGVAGTSDPRGALFEEYIRLLGIIQPKGFLFENVYGITGAQDGQAWREIQTAFKAVGYNLFFRVLDAADYGVPQHRERLFIVGLKEGSYLFPCPTHGPDSPGHEPYFTAGEAVQGADISEASAGLGGRYGHLLNGIPPGLNYSFYTKEMGHPRPVFSWRSKFSDFLYKADPACLCGRSRLRAVSIPGLSAGRTGPLRSPNSNDSRLSLIHIRSLAGEWPVLSRLGTPCRRSLAACWPSAFWIRFSEFHCPLPCIICRPTDPWGSGNGSDC